METGVIGLHPDIIKLLGKLKNIGQVMVKMY